MDRLSAENISVAFAPEGGAIARLVVQDGARTVDLLHRAPWHADEVPRGASPHQRWLAGDFFCAPFGDASADGAPLHGWTANGLWRMEPGGYVLNRAVMGARVTKALMLRDGHPFVYQRHRFEGGQGALPVANHAMVSLPRGGVIATSPKRFYETPGEALETEPARGRSLLRYPARAAAGAFPAGAGVVDLMRYPLGQGHEDFVIGVEAVGHALGWTAVARTEGDLFLSLRHAGALPLTMFWHSNGGRYYAPWSSRHVGVLGVEEGVGLALLGISAGEVPDPLTAAGQPVALHLHPDRVAEVRHVIGCIAWPTGEAVLELVPGHGVLTVRGVAGAVREVAFDAEFLGVG